MAVRGIVLVLTLQLSLPVIQLPLTPCTAAEQVWTWTSAGTAPDAISYQGARKYTVASADAGVMAAPQSGDEENVTHSPQSVTPIGNCPPIDNTVLQIAVVIDVKSIWQPSSPKTIRALGSSSVTVGDAMLLLVGTGGYSVAFVREDVVLSSGRAEVVLKGLVGLIGEAVYGTDKEVEASAGQNVATGTCRVVVGKVLVVEFASVELTDGSVVGTGAGRVDTRFPGSNSVGNNTSVESGPPGFEMICVPAKAP
jgi:hypothetical protein